jgi:hypothetical protein
MKIIFVVLVMVLLFHLISRSSFTSLSSLQDVYKYEKFKNRFTLIPHSTSLNSVDMVYIVAMPQRKDYITKQMTKLDVSYTYFDAIKKGDLTDSEISQLSDVNKRGSKIYNLPTRLFHTLSFTMCFIDAIKKGYSNIIIFEDDIVINVDTDTLNNSLEEFNQSDNDFFYLGYCFLDCKQKQDRDKYKNLIDLTNPSILCNHSTVFKVSALPPLIDYLFPMKIPTDEAMVKYFKLNKTKVCISKKPYFDQVPRDQMESLNVSTNVLKHCR